MARLEDCPTCGNRTSENASLCPSCGEPLSPGWADRVAEQRKQEEEAARTAQAEAARIARETKEEAAQRARLAEEKAARVANEAKKVAAQAARLAEEKVAQAPKKRKRKRRLIGLAIVTTLIALFIGPSVYQYYYMQNLKQNDPEEYQRVIAEREAAAEEERLEEIQELEANVAKVPASDFEENIRLYEKLLELAPENARYTDKLSHYEAKQREAEAAAEAKRLVKKKAAAAAVARKEAEKKRKGFHCLSSWDGSHRAVKKYTEERMRDPDSFEHIETRITPVNENGKHTLLMTYRARNGFGGMTVGEVMATIRNSDCSATVLSIE